LPAFVQILLGRSAPDYWQFFNAQLFQLGGNLVGWIAADYLLLTNMAFWIEHHVFGEHAKQDIMP
jgi:hypothetical protein